MGTVPVTSTASTVAASVQIPSSAEVVAARLKYHIHHYEAATGQQGLGSPCSELPSRRRKKKYAASRASNILDERNGENNRGRSLVVIDGSNAAFAYRENPREPQWSPQGVLRALEVCGREGKDISLVPWVCFACCVLPVFPPIVICGMHASYTKLQSLRTYRRDLETTCACVASGVFWRISFLHSSCGSQRRAKRNYNIPVVVYSHRKGHHRYVPPAQKQLTPKANIAHVRLSHFSPSFPSFSSNVT